MVFVYERERKRKELRISEMHEFIMFLFFSQVAHQDYYSILTTSLFLALKTASFFFLIV